MDIGSPSSSAPSKIARASFIGAAVFAVVVFVSGLAINGFGNTLAGLFFSGWVALPLMLLGAIKLFRRFPLTHAALLVFGVLGSAVAAASPYGHSSTSSIALVTVPFFVLVIFGVTGFVLLCVKTYGE